jgi:hypothetical protein
MGCGCGKRATTGNIRRSSRGTPRRSSRSPALNYEVRDRKGTVVAVFQTAYEARVYSRKYGLPRPVTVAS